VNDLTARLSPILAATVVVLGALAMFGLVVFAFERFRIHRARARAARYAMEAKQTLAAGLTVVSGRVEVEGSDAITFVVHEAGTERMRRGRTTHTWTESSREVNALPFTVVTDDGQRVEVEPDERVLLVDDIAVIARHGATRTRRASLSRGERVAVEGELTREEPGSDGPYRGAGSGRWVLRTPPHGPMVCSTEPLPQRHERWARFWGWSTLAFFAIFAITQAVFAYDYGRLTLWGVVEQATIVDHWHYTTHDRHGTHHHYGVTARVDEGPDVGAEVEDTLTLDGWDRVDVGTTLPFVVLPGHPEIAQAGTAASISFMAPVVLLMLLGFGGAVFAGIRARRLAWYEHRRITTHGSGPL
jgi:hypothetical protein